MHIRHSMNVHVVFIQIQVVQHVVIKEEANSYQYVSWPMTLTLQLCADLRHIPVHTAHVSPHNHCCGVYKGKVMYKSLYMYMQGRRGRYSRYHFLVTLIISRRGLPVYLPPPRSYARKDISFPRRRSRMTRKAESNTVQYKARRCHESPSRQLKNEGEKNFHTLHGQISTSRLYSLPSAVAIPLQNSSRRR